MNKIYRVVWNHAKRTWMVISELSRNATKSKVNKTIPSTTNVIKLSALSLALSVGFVSAATYVPAYGDIPNFYIPF